MKVFVGVDVGKVGFMVLYSKKFGYDFYPMPTERVGTGDFLKSGKEKTKAVFSEKGLLLYAFKIKQKYGESAKYIACIEDVTGRFGWSAQSNFSFGYVMGIQKSLLHLMGAEVHLVKAIKWQSYIYSDYEKVMVPSKSGKKMVHDTKATSAKVSQIMEPEIDFRKTERSKNIDDNKTDAFLINVYCQKIFG